MSDFVKYNGSRSKAMLKTTLSSAPLIILGGNIFARLIRRRDKTHYLIFTPSLGDAMIDLSYLAEFKRQRGINHVTVVCVNYTKRVCGYYPGLVDNIILQKRWEYRALRRFYISRIGQYFFGLHADRISFCATSLVNCVMWDNEIFDYPLFVKTMLYKISLNSLPEKPQIPQRDISGFVSKFDLVKGRTVFLNPSAISVHCDISDLMAAVASELTAKGYRVVTLTAKTDEQPVYGTQALCCTLEEAFSLIEYGGTLIGLRSGFMDVMVYANCRIITINDDDYGWKSFFRLEKLGVNPDCHSVIYNSDDETTKMEIVRIANS